MTHSQFWKILIGDQRSFGQSRLGELIDLGNAPEFFGCARACLQESIARRKKTELAVQLLDGDLLLKACVSPSLLDLDQAREIARLAMQFDPRFDARLLAYVAGIQRVWPEEVNEQETMRCLEILDNISDCSRLVMQMNRFHALPIRRVRSKAAKLIARGIQNAGWPERVLKDPDPRVRSNMIEGLHTGVGPLPKAIKELLAVAARDPHHRVAVTALCVLAVTGDSKSREAIEKMIGHPETAWRKAAEWAMSKVGRGILPAAGSQPAGPAE